MIAPVVPGVPFHDTRYATVGFLACARFAAFSAATRRCGHAGRTRRRRRDEPVDGVGLPDVVLHHGPREAPEAAVGPTGTPRILDDETGAVVADRQHLVVTADLCREVGVDGVRTRPEDIEAVAHGHLDRDGVLGRERLLDERHAARLPGARKECRVVLDLVLGRVRVLGRGRLRQPVVVTLGVVRAGVAALRLRDVERARRVAARVDAAVDLRVGVHRRERLPGKTIVAGVPPEHRVIDRPRDTRADLALVTRRHRPPAQVHARGQNVEDRHAWRDPSDGPARPETVRRGERDVIGRGGGRSRGAQSRDARDERCATEDPDRTEHEDLCRRLARPDWSSTATP